MKTIRFYFSFLQNKIISFQIFLAVIFILGGPGSAFSQNVDRLHIEKVQEEGLSSDFINCINQDSNGFLWFGTREGLFRYDGYNFKAFKNLPGDSVTLSSNAIMSLFPENENLWIGTLGGLNCIDINTLVVKNFPSPEFLQVYAILPKDKATFWIGTSTGLFTFNKINRQWTRVEGLDKRVFVNSLNDDHHGHLYLTTQTEFYIYSKSTGNFKHYHPDVPTFPRFPDKDKKNVEITFCNSLTDRSGYVWFTTWGAGLVRFDPKTEKIKYWSHQTFDVHLIPYKTARDMVFDNYGNIWIANLEGGLTIFNPAKNKFINYPVDWKSETELSQSVVSLFKDRSGTFWIGTESGIYKYDPHSNHWFKNNMVLKKGNMLSQSNSSPLSILKDKSGKLWMGMYDGLFTFDPKNGFLEAFNKEIGIPENFQVFNILQAKNGDYWLNERNLLVKFSKNANEKKKPVKSDIFQSPDIRSNICSLFIDNEQRIWLGTHADGFFRFDPVNKKFISYQYKEKDITSKINEIRTFCELSKDSLLIGGENTGIILLHTNTGRYEKVQWPGLENITGYAFINTIYRNNNDVWIGTEYMGLWQTNRQLGPPAILSVNEGLPSADINSMVADKENNLWLLTIAGAVEIQMPDKKITVFDKKNGIQNLSQLYSIITDNENNIYVGGRGALYSFSPENIKSNTQPPDVLITDLHVFDQDFHIQKGEKIRLNYNQNYFSFEFLALNYTQSRLNRYAYKMENLDKKWNYAGFRHYVSYANLQEGTYIFQVKACNNKGVWNNVPAKLTIIIEQPFWRRLWFYLLVVILMVSIIYSVYAYNVKQLKMRLELRDKIARDLHDDIGSTLSGINIFSKIALQKINSDQDSSKDLLEKISDRSAKTMDALSDIVWSINTRNDGLDNFIRKAREYMSEVLEPKGVSYSFNAEPDMEHLKIGMIIRKELYLIFKEAIYNASKYSKCSLVQICFFRFKNKLTLTIQDNGVGFNINKISSGNGIYNMKQRAKKMNATFSIESKVNEGTMISLSFNIPRFR